MYKILPYKNNYCLAEVDPKFHIYLPKNRWFVGDKIAYTKFFISGDMANCIGTLTYIDNDYKTIGIRDDIDGRLFRYNLGDIKYIKTVSTNNIVDGKTFVSSLSETTNKITDEPDFVNHPPHYQSSTGLEVIDVIKAFTENLTGIEAVCTGNAIKYICRWKEKNGLQDLEKCIWYLNRLIEEVQSKEAKND